MTQQERFQEFYDILQQKIPKETLQLSMSDVHHPGLFSLVIKGTEFGDLTRVFIAHKEIKPHDIQLHSHRYPIRLTAISGTITHYSAKEITTEKLDCNVIKMSKFAYKSPMNGGKGLRYLNDTTVKVDNYIIPNGSSIYMRSDEIHTVSCNELSMWVVEELGFETDESVVLGVPFNTDKLYNTPKLYEINDNYILVRGFIKNLLHNYKSINLI